MQKKYNKANAVAKAVKPEVKETVQEAAKTVEAVAEKVETAAAKTVEKVEETAEAAVEAAKKKTEEVKKTVKKSAKKTTAKKEKEAAKTDIVLQYQSVETSLVSLEDKVKAQFVAEGHRAGCIRTLNIYVKPEEYKAYYVINDKFSGSVDLF